MNSPSSPSPRVNSAQAYKLMGLVVVALLVGFVVWRLTLQPQDKWTYCQKLIPGSEAFELEAGKDDPIIKAKTNRQADTKDVAIIRELAKCVEEKTGKEPEVRLASIEGEPLGQLASRWGGEDGVKVKLTPSENKGANATLNNLKIGPSQGALPKHELLAKWCDANSACVMCQPEKFEASAVAVEISLKASAPTQKVLYQEVAGAPKADGTYEPWQLVRNRKRYIYLCAPS